MLSLTVAPEFASCFLLMSFVKVHKLFDNQVMILHGSAAWHESLKNLDFLEVPWAVAVVFLPPKKGRFFCLQPR